MCEYTENVFNSTSVLKFSLLVLMPELFICVFPIFDLKHAHKVCLSINFLTEDNAVSAQIGYRRMFTGFQNRDEVLSENMHECCMNLIHDGTDFQQSATCFKIVLNFRWASLPLAAWVLY